MYRHLCYFRSYWAWACTRFTIAPFIFRLVFGALPCWVSSFFGRRESYEATVRCLQIRVCVLHCKKLCCPYCVEGAVQVCASRTELSCPLRCHNIKAQSIKLDILSPVRPHIASLGRKRRVTRIWRHEVPNTVPIMAFGA